MIPLTMEFRFLETGINPSGPLIYLWEVVDSDGKLLYHYVGKAKNGSHRPLRHYKRIVNRVLANKPYSQGKPNGFREVHVKLADAIRQGHAISLKFLANISADQDINQVEKEWQEHYGLLKTTHGEHQSAPS